MADDLKSENRKHIYWLLGLPVLLCAAIQTEVTNISEEWLQLAAIEGTSGAFLYAAALLLTNLLPQNMKHKLVFTKLTNEMPAGRVHRLIGVDPRIDPSTAIAKWPNIFDEKISEAQRNSLWYQYIYKPVRDNPPVQQVHRTFLLFRDVTSGLAFIFLASVIWFVFGLSGTLPQLHFAIPFVLLTSTVLTLVVARNAGNRMVVNAVAEAI
jgi:hypothetical protein